jgi:pimeloyl-ACP methyl ester carboxylesterase
VLFLHGFGGTAAHWEPLCRELPGVRAVAVDLPGHGDNAATALDLPERRLSADLAELAERLGGGRPGGIVVAGHSLGALLALRLAAVAPHRVRGLVLLASGFPFRVHPELADQLARSLAPDAGFIAGCLKRPGEHGPLGLLADGFGRMRAPLPADGIWGFRSGGAGTGDLGAVRAPALVIVAEDDVVTSPRKGRALATALPAAELVVLPGAGHYVHMEEPARVAGPVRRFLARAGTGPPARPDTPAGVPA